MDVSHLNEDSAHGGGGVGTALAQLGERCNVVELRVAEDEH